MGSSDKVRVRFAVESDEEAEKITALLEALGYEAIRELDHGSPQTRLRWAVTRLSTQAKLTDRERDILGHVLQGSPNRMIGDELGISKATVKWHMHNIFTKTGAGTREELLRVALQLGGVRSKSQASEAETSRSSGSSSSSEGEASDEAGGEDG